jgi:spoIIIJ-associated protein
MDREESIAYAKKYIEDILSFFGLNTDARAGADEDVIEVSIPSTHLNAFLIGQHGETLRNLQHLVSMTLRGKEAELVRVNIDVADYKRQRNDRLIGQVEGWVKQARERSDPMHLVPMSPAERRVVHQAASDYGDVETHSEGEGRDRHIVLTKKSEESVES